MPLPGLVTHFRFAITLGFPSAPRLLFQSAVDAMQSWELGAACNSTAASPPTSSVAPIHPPTKPRTFRHARRRFHHPHSPPLKASILPFTRLQTLLTQWCQFSDMPTYLRTMPRFLPLVCGCLPAFWRAETAWPRVSLKGCQGGDYPCFVLSSFNFSLSLYRLSCPPKRLRETDLWKVSMARTNECSVRRLPTPAAGSALLAIFIGVFTMTCAAWHVLTQNTKQQWFLYHYSDLTVILLKQQ